MYIYIYIYILIYVKGHTRYYSKEKREKNTFSGYLQNKGRSLLYACVN